MYELDIVILIGIGAAAIGFALGMGLQKSVGSSEMRLRKLEKDLATANARNQAYRDQVTEHFSGTSSLLNDLTHKYKDIHDHLAKGANELCVDDNGLPLFADTPLLSIETKSKVETPVAARPPLDYAPMGEENSGGTLAEDYGLEKVKLDELKSDDNPPGTGPVEQPFSSATPGDYFNPADASEYKSQERNTSA